MNVSPISTSGSTSSSSSSSASHSTLRPPHDLSPTLRRRSVDTGGLNLALNDREGRGSGRGYGGWMEHTQASPGSIEVAELVSAMHEQTHNLIDQAFPTTSTANALSLITDAKREKLILELATWHFDASQLPPDEVLMSTIMLFELLWSIEGMEADIGLSFGTIPPFLTRVSKIYREKTSYHNFQHALDVLQAVYCYLYQAGCVPSIKLLHKEDPDTASQLPSADCGKGKGKVSLAIDVEESISQRRKLWRKPPSDGSNLLQQVLKNRDIFALFVAAVGHDIGHPGLSNAFMKNAKTPLSELFEDKSVLEKMHCTLLLQVMRKHRMGHLLDRLPASLTPDPGSPRVSSARPRTESDPGIINRDTVCVLPEGRGCGSELPLPSTPLPKRPVLKKSASAYPGSTEAVSDGTGTEFRKLLMKTILATDMGVHFKWMLDFQQLVERLQRDAGNSEMDIFAAVADVDFETRLFVCQALIKCADISNPSRPPPACTHWSFSLLAEWTEQSLLEAQLALPISVSASDDPIKAASGQVDFITMSTLPLLKITSSVIPEMGVFVKQCESNLIMWQTKIGQLQAKATLEKNALADITPPATASWSPPLVLPTSLPDVSTMFALSLPAALYSSSSEIRHPSWPASDRESIMLPMAAQSNVEETGHANDAPNGITSSDSTPPLSPSGAAPAVHHRHASHTELPQVSTPSGSLVSFSQSDSQHAKSSCTTASSSPLFSPRSMPTPSSSPRSDISGPTSGPHAVASLLGLQLRPALRAAYDAHGRPKAARRLGNRTSWQGRLMPSSSTTVPPAGSDWNLETAFDLTAPRQTSHGS